MFQSLVYFMFSSHPLSPEPFSTTPTYTNRKKDPVLPRDRQDSCSSNRSTHSADNNDAAQTPSRGGTSRTHHRSSSSSSASQRGVHRSQTISEERVPLLEVEARRPVSGIERTESIGASSSSICSTASTHRALPPGNTVCTDCVGVLIVLRYSYEST